MTTTTERPAWATRIEVADADTADEFGCYSATLASVSPVLHPDDLTRDQELRVIAWQYTTNDGEVPAGSPILELVTTLNGTDGDLGHRGLILTVEDVPKVIEALVEAVAQLGHPREALIRKTGLFVVETDEVARGLATSSETGEPGR